MPNTFDFTLKQSMDLIFIRNPQFLIVRAVVIRFLYFHCFPYEVNTQKKAKGRKPHIV